jgi:hypothetical protein
VEGIPASPRRGWWRQAAGGRGGGPGHRLAGVGEGTRAPGVWRRPRAATSMSATPPRGGFDRIDAQGNRRVFVARSEGAAAWPWAPTGACTAPSPDRARIVRLGRPGPPGRHRRRHRRHRPGHRPGPHAVRRPSRPPDGCGRLAPAATSASPPAASAIPAG